MKRSRYTETQIVKILKEAEAGVAVEELSRQNGFSRSAFYKWKAKYGGMDAAALKRLKELEAEVQAITEDWLEEYNAIRPHEALGDVPPYQYALKEP